MEEVNSSKATTSLANSASTAQPQSLRRPDQSVLKDTKASPERSSRREKSLDHFANRVRSLSALADDDEEKALEEAKTIAIEIKDECKDLERLREMLHHLHQESLESEDFAMSLALLFGCLSQLELEGVKCRMIFLQKIQEEFGKDGQKSNLNLFALLCQVFRRVRLANGTAISVLASPILNVMTALLNENAKDEGISVFVKQFLIVGPELQCCDSAKFKQLVDQLRLCIASAKSASVESILSLLMVLELVLNDWSLSKSAEEFYSSHLSNPIVLRMLSYSSNPSEPKEEARTGYHQHQSGVNNFEANLAALALVQVQKTQEDENTCSGTGSSGGWTF